METKSNYVVVDSSFLVSLKSQDDATHKRAQKIADEIEEQTILVLPAEIFSETINTLWKKLSKKVAIATIKDILEGNYFFPESIKELRLAGLKKFEKQPNSVSFTDCLVMAFADQFKTKAILGFDEAFTKNGYTLP